MRCEVRVLIQREAPTLHLCDEGFTWKQVERVDSDGVSEPKVRRHEVTVPKSGTPSAKPC
eukprot:13376029-Alexandrium_andersonii.AAC.1